jgi:putative hemolysin
MNHSIKVVLKIVGGLLLAGLVGLLVFYVLFTPVSSSGPKPTSEPTADPASAGLPNPASAYCREQGGNLFVITASDDSQYGVCIFPDGSACDEWDFYRGECGPSGNSGTELEPALALNPETASPGQTITLKGSGFARETSVVLRLGAPSTGLGKHNLATVVADGRGTFEAELTLPNDWPGTQQPIVERELIIAAVDETRGQTLAVASFVNAAAGTVECFDHCMIFARDAALVYVAGQTDQPVPAPGPAWQQTALEESMAPEGSAGQVVFRFTAGDWAVTVSCPIGMSGASVYSVALSNPVSGFEWQGTVDSSGQVAE